MCEVHEDMLLYERIQGSFRFSAHINMFCQHHYKTKKKNNFPRLRTIFCRHYAIFKNNDFLPTTDFLILSKNFEDIFSLQKAINK